MNETEEVVVRRPTRIVNQLEESQRILQARGFGGVQILASYPSFMTGLMFHKYEEKPEEHKVYICLPEPNNPHDPHALGIISSRNRRIAFVPKILTEHFNSTFPGIFSGACCLVCYCTGMCTPKSAQCIYNVYQVLNPPQPIVTGTVYVPETPYSPVPQPIPPLPPMLRIPQQTSSVLQTTCTICRGPANRFIHPCHHYACCTNCVSQLFGQACPTCRTIVTGSTTV